jgi:curved DNA-binding protein CbpA
MAGTHHGGPDPDLYQLLGVPRRASLEEIVLAEAYQVLSDPARRAAYDRALRPGSFGPRSTDPTIRARPRHPAGPGVRPPAGTPGPPLWAGPVRVEGPHQTPAAGGWDEQEARLAALARWYLAGEWGRPW